MLRRELSEAPQLGDLAKKIGGEVHGDPGVRVAGICALDEPVADFLCFTSLTKEHQLKKVLSDLPVAAAVLRKDVELGSLPKMNLVLVDDPLRAVVELVPEFFMPSPAWGSISDKADIHPSATLGDGVSVGPFCSISEGVVIGNNVQIYPHVVIYPGVTVGDRTVIHSGSVLREGTSVGSDIVIQNGAVIGADGFGYIPDPKVGLRGVPQVGTAILDDRVHVGANTCIDRATFGTTRIGKDSKLDNLVQIGHNVKIGQYTILCGQVGIAGSCTIGNQVTLGGMVGVADHLKIGDGARVAAKSGVTQSLAAGEDYAGMPAEPVGKWRRATAALRSLPKALSEIRKRLDKIENN